MLGGNVRWTTGQSGVDSGSKRADKVYRRFWYIKWTNLDLRSSSLLAVLLLGRCPAAYAFLHSTFLSIHQRRFGNHVSSSEDKNSSLWFHGEPNLPSYGNCIVLQASDHGWGLDDINCNEYARYSLCMATTSAASHDDIDAVSPALQSSKSNPARVLQNNGSEFGTESGGRLSCEAEVDPHQFRCDSIGWESRRSSCFKLINGAIWYCCFCADMS